MAWGRDDHRPEPRRRGCGSGLLKLLLILLLIVGLVIAGITWWLNQPGPQRDEPTTAAPPSSESDTNPPGCPAVQMYAVPGTWESSATDDPLAPHANPRSLLLSVTAPLGQEFGPGTDAEGRVEVYTVPYPAQFRNPGNLAEMSYDESRAAGTTALTDALAARHRDCPATRFALIGFSQGAVIVGDVAHQLGADGGPVPADRILGSILIADGRREPSVGINPGVPVPGVGVEVALGVAGGALGELTGLGATMTGPRGDFGSLGDRTYSLCAPDDLVCDAPADIATALRQPAALLGGNAVHSDYATNPNVIPGSTATAWATNQLRTWIRQGLSEDPSQ